MLLNREIVLRYAQELVDRSQKEGREYTDQEIRDMNLWNMELSTSQWERICHQYHYKMRKDG